MNSKVTQSQKADMEAILGPDSEPFETFISDHIDSSGENDSEAKSIFNMMRQKDPESLALKLVDYLGPSHDFYTRQECALLLKNLLKDDDLCTWHKLSVSTQSSIKCMILDRMNQEESESIIGELRYTVYTLAASSLPDNNWPELLRFLYQCVTNSSSNNFLKKSVFLIFAQLAEHRGETIVPWAKDLHLVFLNTLNDDALDLNVRIAATKAVINLIQCVSSSNEKERFQDLLPGVLRTLADTLSNGGDEDAACYVLAFLKDLAKNEPRFLRRQLVVVVGSILDIAEDEKLQEGTRHGAVEFLVTLVEASWEKTPGMMKRLLSFISRCLTVLVNLLADMKDEPDWHSAETKYDSTGATSNHGFSVHFLKRFSRALGGKSFVHIAKEQLSAYWDAPEWEKRHAAPFALAQIAKGCSKQVLIKDMEQLVKKVLNCLRDPHPRVRWAACCAIDMLSTVYHSDFQEQYHNQVVPALAATMDHVHPRVQASAAGALSFFCVCNKPEILIPYLDGIVNKLLVLVQNGKQMVQQEALYALSRITESVKEHFRTYYDTVMPYLKTLLRNTDLTSDLILRARAIECISCVGSAVGREIFREDAEQVMEVLMISLQGLQVKGDEPPTAYLLRACAAICDCLGHDFLPYIRKVMPFIIQCAQLEPAITISVKWNQVASCFMLCCFAETLKEDFYPWVSQEPMTDISAVMLSTLNNCLQISPLLNEGELRRIVTEVRHVITESSNRKRKLKERAKSEDFDAEEDELLRREKWQEDHILWQLCRILKTLIKMVKAAFLPFFDKLASNLIPMWGKDKTAQERCTPTVIFASLVRECPEAALKYCDIFLPLFLDASNDENPRVRQNALYGLGLYVEYGSSVFKPVVTEAISRINVVIMHLCAREPENECAYDNAVSALGKICQFHRESINSAQIVPVWLNCLPIKGDLAEAKYVHGELCSMVERSDREVIGPSYRYIPKIISVFAEVLCSEKDLATEETKNRIINILRQLQQTLPSATFESALAYLLPRQEMELKFILSPVEDADF
ncbi:PREDICTED: importin-5-like isoform X2 [Nicotiana attenuata]|uniref:importin-5-like isoform X2 n=1 Tax=Nicotiana attenuata TaxID=49451 RepID=UPI000905A535|nr:PREDICTED: importin-5-like isoform X2 [Nicotiana attenuata]